MKIKLKNIDDLTIREYQNILVLLDSDATIERDIEILTILTDKDEKFLKDFDYKSIKLLLKEANKSLDKLPSLSNNIKPFKLNGKKYKFDLDFDKISTGMFTDLMHFSKGDVISNLHFFASILIRPVKNFKYNSETVVERAEYFLDNLPVIKAYSVSFFLLNLKVRFLENMKPSLVEEMNQMTKK